MMDDPKMKQLLAEVGWSETPALPIKAQTQKRQTSAPASDARDEFGDRDLEQMNRDHAVVNVEGKTRVASLQERELFDGFKIKVWVYSSFTDFKAFHAFPRKFDRSSRHPIGKGAWWLQQQGRSQFNGVEFAPCSETPGRLNLWMGWGCEPRPGDWSLFRRHIEEVVCSGNRQYSEYMFNWMARGVQQPGKPGEVAVVLRGEEGAGKGIVGREFGRIFGHHYLHISDGKHLVGNFNSHLQQCVLLYADEAFFAGDRSHESKLKTLITEPTNHIEPKGVNSYQVRNCIHLIMSSNDTWVVPAGGQARRYFVLDVSKSKMKQFGYFAAIEEQMKNGGREALFYDLLMRDISAFQFRDVPQTEALAEQKQYSRRGLDQLIECICFNGCLPAAHPLFPNIAITSGETDGQGFYPKAKRLAPSLKWIGSTNIASELHKKWGCVPWNSRIDNFAKRGFTFPPLLKLRQLFEERHGPQDWPEQADWQNEIDLHAQRSVDAGG